MIKNNPFTKISFYIFAITVGLLPFFFVPILPLPIVSAKFYLLSLGTILSALFYIVGELKNGVYEFELDVTSLFFILIPIIVRFALPHTSFIYLCVLSLLGYLSHIYFKNKNFGYEIVRALLVGTLVASIFQILLIVFRHSFSPNVVGSGMDFLILEVVLLLASLFILCFKKKLNIYEKIVLLASAALALFFLSIPPKSTYMPFMAPGIVILTLSSVCLGGIFSRLSGQKWNFTIKIAGSSPKIRDAVFATLSVAALLFGLIRVGGIATSGVLSSIAENYYYQTRNLLVSQTSDGPAIQTKLSHSIKYAHLAIRFNEGDVFNYVLAGDIYDLVVPIKAENAYENAKASYQKALSLDPNNKDILTRLAVLEHDAGNDAEATRLYNQINP